MFHKACEFTDDSVMTLAVANALQSYDAITDMEAFKKRLVKVMHEVGMRYPHCGYGGRFYVWIMKNHTEPYNSYGNGSAMRVSPVAWFANSLEECEALAAATAEVTHNHPEGIKGAVAVAGQSISHEPVTVWMKSRNTSKTTTPSILLLMKSVSIMAFSKSVRSLFRRLWKHFLSQQALKMRSEMQYPSAATAIPLPP